MNERTEAYHDTQEQVSDAFFSEIYKLLDFLQEEKRKEFHSQEKAEEEDNMKAYYVARGKNFAYSKIRKEIKKRFYGEDY